GWGRRHDSGRSLADDVVIIRIRDVEVALAVHGHSARRHEPRVGAGAVVTSLLPGAASDGGDHALGRDPADGAARYRIRDVDVAPAVHGHSDWRHEPRVGAGAIGAALLSG